MGMKKIWTQLFKDQFENFRTQIGATVAHSVHIPEKGLENMVATSGTSNKSLPGPWISMANPKACFSQPVSAGAPDWLTHETEQYRAMEQS